MPVTLISKGSEDAESAIKRLKSMQGMDIPEGSVVVTLTAVLKLLSKLDYEKDTPITVKVRPS